MEEMTLSNIAGGAVDIHFDRELQKVVNNIKDAETEANKKREITIKLVFEPDSSRDVSTITIESSSKLAPKRSSGGYCEFQKNGKKIKAVVDINRQGTLFGEGGDNSEGDDE
jgi:uncharacterized protein YpiB (UPF0302 family)